MDNQLVDLAGNISPARARLRVIGRRAIHYGSGTMAVVPLAGLVAILVILVLEAIPAIRYNGWGFFSTTVWNTGNQYGTPSSAGGALHLPGAQYGAWALIAGTLESSAIAICIALPVGVGAAVLVVEKLPRRIAATIGLCLEILAGVPSVVIGLWGVFSFGPWLAHDVYPWLSKMPNVPVLGIFHGNYLVNGEGLLTGGLVLAAMIFPLIASTTRDLLRQVPTLSKEGATALGMTDSESFMAVQARWIRTGVIGAAVLGLGRALGETIAVALVTGSVIRLTPNIFGSMTTIAATIVTQLSSAQADPTNFTVRTLAEAALVLVVISLIVNVAARYLVRRSSRGTALPSGRAV